MKIAYQKVITYEVEVTPEQFVNDHLIKIRKYENEFDFYVRDRLNNGCLVRELTLPEKHFKNNISNFKTNEWTDEDNKMLISALEHLPN